MKYIIAHSSPFNGTVKIGTIEADSPNQAILIAAERDGWDIGTTEDRDIIAFLRSIEDQYIATPADQIPCYFESRNG